MTRLRTALALVSLVLVFGATADVAGAASHQPDGMVRSAKAESFRGNGVYNTNGAHQTSEEIIGARGAADFYVQIENDGANTDSFVVTGSDHTSLFSVKYFVDGRDVSTKVKGGGITVGPLEHGASETVRVRIAARTSVPKGRSITALVRTRSMASGAIDVTRAKVSRPLYSADQLEVLEDINGTRAANHLNRVAMHRTLADKAQAWAVHLASIGRLVHSNLASGVPSSWMALAENVGYYTSLSGMHQQFLISPDHKANIVGRYTDVGTGVARRGEWYYVVHVFMRD